MGKELVEQEVENIDMELLKKHLNTVQQKWEAGYCPSYQENSDDKEEIIVFDRTSCLPWLL